MFKKEKVKDLHYSISGFLSWDDIMIASDAILQEHGKSAKMPGFRDGHIPLDVLRKKHGPNAQGEAIDKMMNADLNAFTESKKIRIAATPVVDVSKFEAGKDVEYTLEFDILPKLPNIDLEKYTITKKVAKLDEAEVIKSLENLRKSRAMPVKQEANYPAENGDVAIFDFKGFIGDTAFEGGEAKKHNLILGSGSFIPGFEEQLVGHKAGDIFDVTVQFPKQYHSADLAGKDARFEIEMHELRKHEKGELNDELAKSVGHETVDLLKEHIRKILNEQYTEASNRDMREELLEILADKVKLDLPESLINQEFDMAKAEFDKHAGHDHAKGEKFEEKKERKDAEKRVKLGLILAEWGTLNKIEVSREDLQKAIWAEAASYPDPNQVYEFYNKNENALSMLRGMLFEKKALDAMIERVKTKEKNVKSEELFKQSGEK